jgi:hypothetical protein
MVLILLVFPSNLYFLFYAGCYSLFAPGRLLSEPSVARAYDLAAEAFCRDKCNRAATTGDDGFGCTFYSFG